MIDDATALNILRSRGLGLRVSRDNNTWRVTNSAGEAISRTTFNSPNDALEDAEAILSQSDMRRDESKFSRLRQSLESGVYVPWPRVKADGTQEWLVMRVNDRIVMSNWQGWIACVVEIARLQGIS